LNNQPSGACVDLFGVGQGTPFPQRAAHYTVQSDAVNTFLEFFSKSLKSPPDGGLTVLAKA